MRLCVVVALAVVSTAVLLPEVAALKAAVAPFEVLSPESLREDYPEQWPRSLWQNDSSRMSELGIRYVRIAEFSWSKIEPNATSGYQWGWLDDALDTLGVAGLQVVLGTPTATPPKWLVDKYPDILPVGSDGQPRRFGSRRHYSFSSETYRRETERIVTAMAQRYGNHPYVAGWQVDNEYGCHGTIRTYDNDAATRFRKWLENKYATIDRLNDAWGNAFWSMEYVSFEEVDLPLQTVTEANPSHRLDFYRFSSDMTVEYNLLQVDILRRYSPGRFITHNFMGLFLDFDAHKLAESLDFATWDSYPLGFTDSTLGIGELFTDEEKVKYARTGQPDLASFHHSLYLHLTRRYPSTFWVMEQQPGPVNWANNNPSPAAGMIRLWSWEAFAHGASTVSYFRWRQALHAQEQNHAGLNRPDNTEDVGFLEARNVREELNFFLASEFFNVQDSTERKHKVALLVSFESFWMSEIQPQGSGFSTFRMTFNCYRALRTLALDVDVIPMPRSLEDIEGYRMVVVPSVMHVSDAAAEALKEFRGPLVVLPRTGSKTADFSVPSSLPVGPAALRERLGVRVVRSESFRPTFSESFKLGKTARNYSIWRDWVDPLPSSDVRIVEVASTFADGYPAIVVSRDRPRQYADFSDSADDTAAADDAANKDNGFVVAGPRRESHYIAFWPDVPTLTDYFKSILVHKKTSKKDKPSHSSSSSFSSSTSAKECQDIADVVVHLPETLRVRRRDQYLFAFNYDDQKVAVPKELIGSTTLPIMGRLEGHDIAIYEMRSKC